MLGSLIEYIPWYAYLVLWPLLSIVLGPPIGCYLRRLRRRREASTIEIDNEVVKHWRKPKDDEWRNKWH